MTSHAYKKASPKPPFSFVRAVTAQGDLWWVRAPRAACDPFTSDRHDLALMSLMERGVLPRVEQ